MATPIQRITRGVTQMPSWLRQQILADEAMQFAPRPSVNEIVSKMGIPRAESAEDFLRQLTRESDLAERLAAKSADEAFTPDVNIFGAPVKTMKQGLALGERNLPGIENLSPEDQIALSQALEKGAMLRAMTATAERPDATVRNWSGGHRTIQHNAGNREDAFTGAGTPFLGSSSSLDMGSAMALLQNKRDLQRLTGMNADLPNPPAMQYNLLGELVPSETATALGDDVAKMVRTIRRDQIDSRLSQIPEMQQSQLMDDMARSADEVSAMEGRAREYDGLPPETVMAMDRANRSHMATMSGRTERLTGDPRYNWMRQMSGNMDPVVPQTLPEGVAPAQPGMDLLKAAAIGGVAAAPLIYGAYRYQSGQWPFGGKESEADLSIAPEAGMLSDAPVGPSHFAQPPSSSAFLAEADDLPEVPMELPDMPVVRTPETQIGMPSDDAMAFDSMGDDAELAAESSPPPTIEDLDAELRAQGLQGVPSWYIRAMKDPSVKLIDGMPKEQFMPFSSKSKEYPIQQRFALQGMTR